MDANNNLPEFSDYFEEILEYPSPTEDMLPLGTQYVYISSTFLNGWINYVKIISAQLVSRYTSHPENLSAVEEIRKNLNEISHFDFAEPLDDDVLILAKSKFKGEYLPYQPWWFFWYDRDCSDCCIGRFETDDSDETVIRSFKAYADHKSKNLGYEHSGQPAIELPLSFFRGWISG